MTIDITMDTGDYGYNHVWKYIGAGCTDNLEIRDMWVLNLLDDGVGSLIDWI